MNVLAALDIGTNSVRLEVVRVEADHSLTTITQQKETVRLGQGEFHTNRMSDAAMARGALVCARFADVARGFGADEIIAVATSAVREAENQQEFIERVREEAGIDLSVISGPEEARLIYLGVSSGADLGDRRALFIDIGGGSLELILGDASTHYLLDSVKLGAIRMADRFLHANVGPVSGSQFARMKEYAHAVAGPTLRRFKEFGFGAVYGSAGTITNLADVTARRMDDSPTTLRNYVVKLSDLAASVEMLCKLPLEDRRRVAGLDADRADIILGGAATLLAVLEEVGSCGVDRITISDRGLRDGILIDRLMREDSARETIAATPLRRRSILQLARACSFDEEHARHVTALSLSLFDELKRLGLHSYGARERELLDYAAHLHDVGCFISHSNHQRHAYYLIRHSDLLGFNDEEIAIIANVALYHRKQWPKKKHENMQDLTGTARRVVGALSAILRVAEGLDRSHLGLVKSALVRAADTGKGLVLTLFSDSDCELERWGVETNVDLFEFVFGGPVQLEVVKPGATGLAPPLAARQRTPAARSAERHNGLGGPRRSRH